MMKKMLEEQPGVYMRIIMRNAYNEETFTFVNELILSFRCPSLLIVYYLLCTISLACLTFPYTTYLTNESFLLQCSEIQAKSSWSSREGD